MSDDEPRVRLAENPFEYAVAECPYCDRSERFSMEDHGAGIELAARAWATGHIQAEHEDELPPYENTDGSDPNT